MIVALFVVVCVLDVVMLIWLAVVIVNGFETPSVLERYAELRRQRRLRRYTLRHRTRVLA